MVQSDALEKLASTGLLKKEQPGREEIAGLLHTATVRLEDRYHRQRNATEYEGIAAVDEKLLDELIEVAIELSARVRALAASHGFSE
jgi:hypothetical protein